ncbi:hypothetical protein [Amycolatopsis benzoatilytica]|uniref:hypothetical protein n=1 Tax=Amycolatopsis benzoatilytica TaxID=346045 RepID=UPI0003A29EF9|nr:hypothetical protein [Amycolatopsis benzoatilytica]
MDTDTTLDALFARWIRDVESIPVPQLVSVDIALAAIAVQRVVADPVRRAAPDSHRRRPLDERPALTAGQRRISTAVRRRR